MNITALLFDLGGTLFSYARQPQMGRAIFSTASAMGIDAEPQVIGQAWRTASEQTMTGYARRDYFLHRDLFRDTLTAFADTFDKVLTAEVAEQFEHDQRQAVIDHLPLRDDCHDTLGALKSRGLYLAIVSNIDDDYLQPLVEKHRLDEVLDTWTSSEEAQSCKPHTAIYHYCLNKGELGVEETLFVGDSLHHDVAGAGAVGMRSAHITEAGITTPLTSGLQVTTQPDYQISELSELVGIVDELNSN